MRKLSSEETRAINELVNQRVKKDYASLLRDISQLELSRDKAENRLREALESARKEADRDKSLVREYKRGFGSVSQLLSTKEQRFEGKLERAENLMKEAEEQLRQAESEKKSLLAECRDKDKIIEDMSREMAKHKAHAKQVADYRDIVEKNENMRKEILRLKFDLDVQRKENTRLLKDLDRVKSGLPVGLEFLGAERDIVSKQEIVDTDLRGIRRSRSTSLLRQRDVSWIPRSLSNTRRELKDPAHLTRNRVHSALDQQAYLKIQNAPITVRDPSRPVDNILQPAVVDRYHDRWLADQQHQRQATSSSLLRRRQRQELVSDKSMALLSAAVAPIPSSLQPHEGHNLPKCTPDCHARQNLEECRTHLARTCQQNAYLSYTLANLRDAAPGDPTGRAINLNVQLKQVGLDNMYSYRQRAAVKPTRSPIAPLSQPPLPPPPPPAMYTAPRVDDLYLAPATTKFQDYNTSRRVRKFDQPRYIYRK